MQNGRNILILNGGSSSLKFAVCESARSGSWTLRGQFERIGTSDTLFIVTEGPAESRPDCGSMRHGAATGFLLDWLTSRARIDRRGWAPSCARWAQISGT
ncbi:acetate kinase [Sinorhizobium fredii]